MASASWWLTDVNGSSRSMRESVYIIGLESRSVIYQIFLPPSIWWTISAFWLLFLFLPSSQSPSLKTLRVSPIRSQYFLTPPYPAHPSFSLSSVPPCLSIPPSIPPSTSPSLPPSLPSSAPPFAPPSLPPSLSPPLLFSLPSSLPPSLHPSLPTSLPPSLSQSLYPPWSWQSYGDL